MRVREIVQHLGVGDREFSHDVAGVCGLGGELHKQVPMLSQSVSRPVAYAHLLALLLFLADHHDTGHAMLPHHPPEIVHCRLHWSLSEDVLMPALVALWVIV